MPKEIIRDLEGLRDRILETDLCYRIFTSEMTALTAAVEYLKTIADLEEAYKNKIAALEGFYAKENSRT